MDAKPLDDDLPLPEPEIRGGDRLEDYARPPVRPLRADATEDEDWDEDHE